jgi:4-hydroxybutyrate dehydrogenase/sulfolactaldehyde 3-reductase
MAGINRVGFVGLGNMGGPMASNLVAKGFAVTVFDVVPARIRILEQRGATPAASLGALIDAVEAVLTMLPNTPDVAGVVEGKDGLLARGRPGLLHLDMSTIAPSASQRFARALTEKGMRFVDSGVGRSPMHAERGESLFMVGAHDEDLQRVRPLLDAMGDTVIHCGPPGSGIAMKVVNNFVGMIQAQVTAEALTLGARMGLSADLMHEVISGTLSANGHLKSYYPLKSLAGDIEPGFALDLALKDLSIAVDLARELAVPVKVGDAAQERLRSALDGFSGKDVTALLDAASRDAGIPPPRLAKR